jgi:branched-chain amino acid transport system permease protein
MRHLFRTHYQQDIALWRHNGDRFWYALLAVVALIAPQILGEFYIGELGAVYIFAIAGVGLMLLVGYTGLISLGHAAFLGIGAYVNAVLLAQGVPFLITLPVAGLFTALCGAAIGRPTLRMSGLYLAIATLAFGSIVGTVFQKWNAVTGGFDGFAVPTPYVFGIAVEGATGIYYVSLVVLAFVLWISANLLRSPTGRAMVAIRDSEVSAQSMGIHLARYKTLVFAVSAGMTGLAGALFAHYVRFLAPDAFDVLLSVQFVTIVFVGGLGSLRGAILGAMFVRLLPQFIAIVRDDLPFGIGRLPGLEPSLFGLVLVLVILFQPGGLNGMWLKAKLWFQAFPFKRQTSFRRQKSYAKSERLR